MKKFLVLAAAALLVVAIALPSFAAETTISGTYRIRSIMDFNYDKKLEDTNGISHDNPLYTGYFDQRFRVKVTHARSEFLKAVIIADLTEDTWGQQRSLRWNNSTGATAGWINGAYIEAITPIGMISAGGRGGQEKFGVGTWSDSGMKGNGSNNYGITYAILLPVGDAKVAASLSYIKYVDLVQPVISNLAGGPPAGAVFRTWPGRAMDEIGGPGTSNYNIDTDTYVLSAHYIGDNIKASILFQYVADPRANGAGLLAKGITNQPLFPGINFLGEEGTPGAYAPLLGINTPGNGPYGPTAVYWDGVNGRGFVTPLYPTPASAYVNSFGPGAGVDAINNVGVNAGMGQMGMYGVNVFIAAAYVDMKFFDDKLQFKAEFDRIWGIADLNGYGAAYNEYLDSIQNLVAGVSAGPTTMGGNATTFMGTNLMPGQRVPNRIYVDSVNIYADVSYHTDLFTLGVAFLYGSGEKYYVPFTQSHLGLNNTGNDDFHWSNIIVSGDWGWLNSSAPLGLNNTEENVTSVKFYWSVCPFDKLDIHGAFVWAKYSEPVGRYAQDENGNLIDNWHAFYGHPMNYATTSSNHTYIPAGVDDDLGWEIDFGVTWTIMEGLSLNSEFGVLFTGDAFDYRNTVTGEREEWGEIYRWVNTLTYEF